MRCQNLYIPIPIDPRTDPQLAETDEPLLRVAMLNLCWRTLHNKFLEFASEHINGFYELPGRDIENLDLFIHCHVRVLKQYKKFRPGQAAHDPVQNYFLTARLDAYEGARRHWMQLHYLHYHLSLPHSQWYPRVSEAYFHMGLVYQHMDDVLDGLWNAGERHLSSTVARKKGAMTRHAENHAMKADVFNWLDTNMANFKSMDAAAEVILKLQPIAFRTARDWVGEWKKLRSASTP